MGSAAGTIRFPCPTCGLSFEVAAANAGRRGRCPRCQGEFVAPAASPPPALTPAPVERAVRLEVSGEVGQEDLLALAVAGAEDLQLPAPGGPPRDLLLDDPIAAALLAGPEGSSAPPSPDPDQPPGRAEEGAARATSSRRAGRGSARGAAGEPGRETSSRRQRPAPSEAPPPAQAQPPWGLLVGGCLVGLLILGGVSARRGRAPAPAPSPSAASLATPEPSPSPSASAPETLAEARRRYYERRVADLEADLELVGGDQPERRGGELERLRADLARLQVAEAARPLAARLAACAERLEALRREGGGVGDGLDELAWAALAAQLRARCSRALASPASGWARAVETQLAGAAFRTGLRRELEFAALEGSLETCRVAADPRWAGLLAEADYLELVRRAQLILPEDARRQGEWPELEASFTRRAREAAAYAEAQAGLARAFALRDASAAAAALQGKSGPWIEALARLIAQPSYQAYLRPQSAGPSAGGEPAPVVAADSGGGQDGGAGGEATRVAPDFLAGDWRVRFRLGAKRYRAATGEAQEREAAGLVEALGDALRQARESHEICCEALELLDEHERLVEQEPRLALERDALHQLYFEVELRRASGPLTFNRLDQWCRAHGHEEWCAQLAPWLAKLRLVGQDAKKREQERRARAEGIASARRFARSRRGRLSAQVEELIEWLRAQGYGAQAAKDSLRALAQAALAEEDPFAAARLEALIQAVPPSEEDPKLARAFEREREAVIEDLRKRSFKAIATAIEAGEPGLGFDFLQFLLRVDPGNEKAHKKLGHVEVEGRWLRRFEAAQLKRGLGWDPAWGWVVVQQRARYEQGEVFDLQEKRWRGLSEANQAHSQPADPWVIATEHFELRSTADLAKSAWIAERLERFYLVLFRHYDLFFAHKGAAGLVFGVAAQQQKPLVVNFYRSRQQYVEHSDPLPNSAGFYSPAKHASFFYDQGEQVSTLQHEVTHQILGETLSGGRTSAWLAEGAAVYLEGVSEGGGQLRLGGLLENQDLAGYVRLLPGGAEHTFSSITSFHDQGLWGKSLDHRNYRGAGAAVYFLIHMDEGRYRGDFLRMLKEGYLGQRSDPARYLNLGPELLDELMARFYAARAGG